MFNEAPLQPLSVIIDAGEEGGCNASEPLFRDPYPQLAAERFQELTGPKDRLLGVEGGWGRNYPFLSGRENLSICNTAFVEDDMNLQRLRSLGLNRLVLCRESPILAPPQQNNPGNEGYRRKTYDHALTESARQWTTLYEDEDMAIKQLP